MTAFATGTATNAADLYAKLTAFLTTNAALVAASQAWALEWGSGDEIVLQGPGLSGDDQVMVGMRLTSDAPSNTFNLWINGMTGILSGASVIEGHTNVSPTVAIYLDSSPMTYWFVASGRRFVVVVQISTVFEALYGGLFLPYGTPAEYPYPLCVGGSRGVGIAGVEGWASADDSHTLFTKPFTGIVPTRDSSFNMLDPAGQWLAVANTGLLTSVGLGPDQMFANYGTIRLGGAGSIGYLDFLAKQRECFGGGYALTPLTLVQNTPDVQTYGILDGVYHAPGFANSAANIITVASLDHLVVQNVFRAGLSDLWALALG